jgi:predicted nucleic acid-binding protein
VVRLITDLGAGEAQALTLALEEPGSLVILDDRYAREVATLRNIRFTGTGGVILKAKQEGHISAVAPLLNQLIHSGFWLSDILRARILKLAQE